MEMTRSFIEAMGFSLGVIMRRDILDKGYPLSMCVYFVRKSASPLHRHLGGWPLCCAVTIALD
jgi:hypothetical protein